MRPITKVLRGLSPQEYYETHLHLIQHLLPAQLTNKEVSVLAAFMSLDGPIAEQDRFGTQCRKLVMAQTGIKHAGGLGNYLRAFEDKKFIYKENGDFKLNGFIVPDPVSQEYRFKIEKI